jgi:hypothetical protein
MKKALLISLAVICYLVTAYLDSVGIFKSDAVGGLYVILGFIICAVIASK